MGGQRSKPRSTSNVSYEPGSSASNCLPAIAVYARFIAGPVRHSAQDRDGENGLKIGQQFSAVRKALESTYLRMTVCFMAQELEAKLAPDEQKADLAVMMKDLEALLARVGLDV